MTSAVPDRRIESALRPFVRSTRPVLDALRESDPFGLRERVAADPADDSERALRDRVLDWASGLQVPGTAAWASMDVDERGRWWIGRVGRFTALLAAVPGIGGALARRLPVQDIVGLAGQGLLVCALAGERGVRDENDQVRLLAAVLFGRELTVEVSDDRDEAAAQAATDEITEELAEAERKHGRATLAAVGRTLWRMGRLLWGVHETLDARPQGKLWHRALGNLPVVGVLGNYLGERSALHRIAGEVDRRLGDRQSG